jgi:hypothetical protein
VTIFINVSEEPAASIFRTFLRNVIKYVRVYGATSQTTVIFSRPISGVHQYPDTKPALYSPDTESVIKQSTTVSLYKNLAEAGL